MHGSNPGAKGQAGSSLLDPLLFFHVTPKKNGRLGGWAQPNTDQKPSKTRIKRFAPIPPNTPGNARVCQVVWRKIRCRANRKSIGKERRRTFL
jgi:hypothetical protein